MGSSLQRALGEGNSPEVEGLIRDLERENPVQTWTDARRSCVDIIIITVNANQGRLVYFQEDYAWMPRLLEYVFASHARVLAQHFGGGPRLLLGPSITSCIRVLECLQSTTHR